MTTENQTTSSREGIASFLDSGEFSDITITVKDNKVFKVHKNIISSQSKFFYNVCTKDFKEKKEANIDLSEQDPEAVEALLEYLYKNDYTRFTKDNVNALVLHVHVYQLADMYDIAKLKEVAAALFEETAEQDWELPAFPLAIQEIYMNAEDDTNTLRKLVVNQAMTHIETLVKDENGEFAQSMTAFSEFGKDLFKASIQQRNCLLNVAYFTCKFRCGWRWKVDQRKACRAFQNNPICPLDKSSMVEVDMGKETYHSMKCNLCEFVMDCYIEAVKDCYFSELYCIMNCPSCDKRTNFSLKPF